MKSRESGRLFAEKHPESGLSDKYDLTKHPNYKDLAEENPGNSFDIGRFLNHRMKLKADDLYEVVDE